MLCLWLVVVAFDIATLWCGFRLVFAAVLVWLRGLCRLICISLLVGLSLWIVVLPLCCVCIIVLWFGFDLVLFGFVVCLLLVCLVGGFVFWFAA